MKNLTVLFFVCVSIMSTGCYTVIKPGYVGIKVNQNGSQKGPEDFPVLTGRIWYNPWLSSVYDYPTFMQNTVWDKNERISFNTAQGSKISCDVALSYTLNPERVPYVFVKHRNELEHITHNYLRNKVRDAINKHSAEYTAIEALSNKTQEIITRALQELKEVLEPEGFMIDTLSFVSAPEPEDQNVKNSISQVISSTQNAIQAENKVKQIEAEARQQIAKAEGEAQSILLEAKAQAEANKILAASITPEFIRYKMLEKWDGVAPKVVGSEAGMMFNMEMK